MGGNLGPDQVDRGQLGAIQGQQGQDGGRGTWGKMVGWGHLGWGGGTGSGIPDKGCSSRQGMEFQTELGSRQGMGFQTWGWGSWGWGSRQGMGFQSWGGVSDRDVVSDTGGVQDMA